VDAGSTLDVADGGWLTAVDPIADPVGVGMLGLGMAAGPTVLDDGLDADAEPGDALGDELPAADVDPGVVGAGGAADVVHPPTSATARPSAVAAAMRAIQTRRERGTCPR
jgi:hypothetical protein